MGAGQSIIHLAQSSRRRSGSVCVLALALATATAPARAGGYVGDFALAAPDYANSGATVWTGAHDYSQIQNPAGASILNKGQASGAVVGNSGVIRNAPAATWNGDLALGANAAGAEVVNQGRWNGALNNSGGGIDNSGTASSANNAAGVFANEGTITGDVGNGGQAANNGTIAGRVTNASQFVNNGAGQVGGGLVDSGATSNNGVIAGGVRESGAFTNNASGRVTGGLALNSGSAVNNGAIDGGASVAAGSLVDNGAVRGGATVAGAAASFTVNGALSGKATVKAGSLVVNSAGAIAGDVANAGSFANAGVVHGGVVNAEAFVNTGVVDGVLRQSGGQTSNDGVVKGEAAFLSGAAVNNGAIDGAVRVGAKASLIDNGVIGGATVNQGAFTQNAAGVLNGRLLNEGQATINGVAAQGATNRGDLTVNAAGRVENGLVTEGGSTRNAGVVTGGAVVKAGLLTSSGVIAGGLRDAGLVEASGVISGPISITGKLMVGGAAPTGARLTITPGSTVSGVVTVPVDLSTGQANFLAAKGAALAAARLDLAGRLSNPAGAYWGRLSLSDTPIALTADAKAALAAASGPLYAYSADGAALVQTINPGLGVTAAQVAAAATEAFALALGPVPSDFERAPADPTPNLGAGAIWTRGFGASLTLSGENYAASGPAFDPTRLAARLAGGEFGLEYGLHNIENSGMSLRLGLEGGAGRASLADAAGSGLVTLPFVGAYAGLSGNGFTGAVEARYVALQMQLTDAPLAVYGQSQRASGMIYAAQASYHLALGALFVEPEAGVTTARLAIANEATNVGDLAFGPGRFTLGHAGAKIGGEFAAGALAWTPYVLASVWREWRAGATVSVANGPTFTPTGLSAFEQVGLGVSATLAHSGLSGFAQMQWALGPKISGLVATSGLRFDF
ncbi:MAG: hypothetical protein KGM15_11110 [Pseudomonadota bacterium]|nr:hypothetical protein [Pseudomonadota bacterium]